MKTRLFDKEKKKYVSNGSGTHITNRYVIDVETGDVLNLLQAIGHKEVTVELAPILEVEEESSLSFKTVYDKERKLFENDVLFKDNRYFKIKKQFILEEYIPDYTSQVDLSGYEKLGNIHNLHISKCDDNNS